MDVLVTDSKMKIEWKSILWGFVGTIIAALIISLCLALYVVWNRAARGSQAYDYIQQVIAEQQKQQANKTK